MRRMFLAGIALALGLAAFAAAAPAKDRPIDALGWLVGGVWSARAGTAKRRAATSPASIGFKGVLLRFFGAAPVPAHCGFIAARAIVYRCLATFPGL